MLIAPAELHRVQGVEKCFNDHQALCSYSPNSSIDTAALWLMHSNTLSQQKPSQQPVTIQLLHCNYFCFFIKVDILYTNR